ncbi:MAG: hypothetical protein ACRCX2_23970 [Paraclostridium sp.]
MSVTLYNLDKVERESFKIKLGGVEHEIKEPTVKDFAKIQQIDFNAVNSHLELFEIMCPTIDVDKLTKVQMSLLIEICFKLIKGDGGKKRLSVEELIE